MYYQTRSAAWLAPRLSCGDVFDNPIYPFFYHDYCITYAEHYKAELTVRIYRMLKDSQARTINARHT